MSCRRNFAVILARHDTTSTSRRVGEVRNIFISSPHVAGWSRVQKRSYSHWWKMNHLHINGASGYGEWLRGGLMLVVFCTDARRSFVMQT